jgi:hypothetical protein
MAASPINTSFSEVALRLLDNAWRPLPTNGKAPAMVGWSDLCRLPWDYEDLVSAVADYAGDYGCGIAADTGHVIIDIDVLDEALAADIGGVANSTFGPTPLIRVGLAPKSVRIYRRNPREAIASRKLHPLEVLSGSGQVVGFGIHVDTGKPYRWVTGSSPLTIAANSSDIPLITNTQLQQFLTTAHEILSRSHYGLPARTIRPRRAASLPHDLHQVLRLNALHIGFERAAIGLLENAHEGIRHLTMWAVVSSAAGRGVDAGRLIHLFEQHFAGWDGVSREAFEHALNQVYGRDHRYG